MEFKEFAEVIRNKVREILGDGYNVELIDVLKNNSVKLLGITIREDGESISPTIYLEDYFKQYREGRDIEDIVNAILRVNTEKSDFSEIDPGGFMKFGKIRKRIVYRLVNYDSNRKFLESVPHRRYLDLAVIYTVIFGETNMGFATVTIKNEHLTNWGRTEATLWKYAERNTPRLMNAEIMPVSHMIRELTGMDLDDETDLYSNDQENCMYVVTNSKRLNGAGCMLYDHLLEDFAHENGEGFYILPSSVHEILLVKKNDELDLSKLKEMVYEINRTQVSPQEVLSDEVYEISEGEIRIAA